jgi:peptide/nickel transport system ATP-binding protein
MMPSVEPILKVQGLRKFFVMRRGFLSDGFGRDRFVRAVDGVSFDIRDGEVLSLVGESGCGKTTIARLILRLLKPTEGAIIFEGQDIFKANREQIRRVRKRMQAVFQDPYSSLDPKKTVYQIVLEPLAVNNMVKDRKDAFGQVNQALTAVGLVPSHLFLGKFPHELSGGQRQRVAIARAIVMKPRFIVADEPVSMLDVSIRAEILRLILELKEKFNGSDVPWKNCRDRPGARIVRQACASLHQSPSLRSSHNGS